MKVVLLGNTNLLYSWFVRSFRQGFQLLGHTVHHIDYRATPIDQIKSQLYQLKPDIMFVHLTFHPGIKPLDQIMQLYADIRRDCGTKIIHYLADARHEPRYAKDISSGIDMALLSQTENLEKFGNYWGVPTFYCPYSAMTQENMALPVEDLMFKNPVFTGSPDSHPDRSQFIRYLQKLTKIEIFQTQSPQDLRNRTAELSTSATCILGLCTGYDIGGYIDVRPFQYLGAGAFMIIRKFKDMDKIIPDDLYIPFYGYEYSDAEFVSEEFCYWKYENTLPIRQSAFDYMQRYHSSKVRMSEILDYLKEI